MLAKADKPDETRDQLSVGSWETSVFTSHNFLCTKKKKQWGENENNCMWKKWKFGVRREFISLGMDTKKTNTITNSNEHCTVKSILHYHKFLRDAQKVFVNQISDFFTESKKQTEVDKLENNTTVSKFLLITYCHCSENLVKHS